MWLDPPNPRTQMLLLKCKILSDKGRWTSCWAALSTPTIPPPQGGSGPRFPHAPSWSCTDLVSWVPFCAPPSEIIILSGPTPIKFSHGCLWAEEQGRQTGWHASLIHCFWTPTSSASRTFLQDAHSCIPNPVKPGIPGPSSRLTIPFVRKRKRDSFRKGLVWRFCSLMLRNLSSRKFYLTLTPGQGMAANAGSTHYHEEHKQEGGCWRLYWWAFLKAHSRELSSWGILKILGVSHSVADEFEKPWVKESCVCLC